MQDNRSYTICHIFHSLTKSLFTQGLIYIQACSVIDFLCTCSEDQHTCSAQPPVVRQGHQPVGGSAGLHLECAGRGPKGGTEMCVFLQTEDVMKL